MMHSHHGTTSGIGSASGAPLALQSRDRLSPVQTLTAIDALVGAMQSERKLVDDLTQTMRRQRAAVAGDDLDGLDDSVFATHRLVQTLGEARRRRRYDLARGWRFKCECARCLEEAEAATEVEKEEEKLNLLKDESKIEAVVERVERGEAGMIPDTD